MSNLDVQQTGLYRLRLWEWECKSNQCFQIFFFQSYEETQAQDGEDKRAKHLAGFKKKMDKKLICPICGEGDPEGENFDMTKLGHIFYACRISATRISPPKRLTVG